MSQSVKLSALLKAKPGMSRGEFERRWVDGHAPLTLKLKHLKGYRINVAIGISALGKFRMRYIPAPLRASF